MGGFSPVRVERRVRTLREGVVEKLDCSVHGAKSDNDAGILTRRCQP